MDLVSQTRDVLRDVLGLGARADSLDMESQLLGAVPELDSMAVAGVIAALERRFGFMVDDDDISGADFATLGSLVRFISARTSPG